MHDLAIIIISTNEARWLTPCLATVFAHAGEATLDVVIADNQSTDGTRELVERDFPAARVVTCENRGFGHGNNRGYVTTDARYVLFLNPDTEIVEGQFDHLVARMDARPDVGLAGVRQLDADHVLHRTIRRFPTPARAWGEALFGEKLPVSFSWLGERVLDASVYSREVACDWTSGSFMIVRREALESAGFFDERMFIYSEETDLCRRIKTAGWEICHLPQMTIIHHEGKAGISRKMLAQEAVGRRQYADKHFSGARRLMYLGGVAARYALRSAPLGSPGGKRDQRISASRHALRALLGLEPPPFGHPPSTAVAGRRPMLREPGSPQVRGGSPA